MTDKILTCKHCKGVGTFLFENYKIKIACDSCGFKTKEYLAEEQDSPIWEEVVKEFEGGKNEEKIDLS